MFLLVLNYFYKYNYYLHAGVDLSYLCNNYSIPCNDHNISKRIKTVSVAFIMEFRFLQKFRFFTKISIFCENFDFIFQNFVFFQDFNFLRKFRFFSKISIFFSKIFDLSPKFRVFKKNRFS